MKFLVSRNVIHRDLAARNIMIDQMKNAKIGDFGLCIDANDRSVDISGKLPIKWLAIECLESHKFSSKSDVWSFGMVLWEMYSMGDAPFVDIEPTAILEELKSGRRPKRPLLASDKLDEVMQRCWQEYPTSRPSFDELLTIFTILLEQATEGYGYLQLMSNEFYKTLPQVEVEAEEEQEIEELESRSRAASTKSAKIHILGNVLNAWRAAAHGIGRQLSSGKGIYPTPDHPRINKKRKSGTFGEATEENVPKLPQPTSTARRKSQDFLTWTGLRKIRRRSLDPEVEQNGVPSSRDVPRLFNAKKFWKPRRKSSNSLPDHSHLEIPPESSDYLDEPSSPHKKRSSVPPMQRFHVETPVSPSVSDSDSEMATLPSMPRASSCDTLSQN
ncbi:unnamed protein product, partial [Mesorhabditis spiculigera]